MSRLPAELKALPAILREHAAGGYARRQLCRRVVARDSDMDVACTAVGRFLQVAHKGEKTGMRFVKVIETSNRLRWRAFGMDTEKAAAMQFAGAHRLRAPREV